MSISLLLAAGLQSVSGTKTLETFAKARPLAENAVVEASPGFLGPRREPISRERPLRKDWPAAGPALLWARRTGAGYAAPAVVAGHLVFFHRVGDEEVVECLDPATGRRRWRQAAPVEYEDSFGYSGGPRCCPLIDGGHVYTYGVAGRLQCLKLEDGKEVWHRELNAELKIPQLFFGVGATPLLVGDRLIVNVGAPDGPCVAAFDRKTGKRIWGAGKRWFASYSSPVVATLAGQRRLLVFGGGKSRPPVGGLSVLGLDGELLWEFPWRSKTYFSVNAATPVVHGDEVFLTESYGVGGVKLRIDDAGKGTVAWKNPGFDLHFTTPVLVDGHLYGFAGEKDPQAELVCVDWKSGKTRWREALAWDERIELSNRIVKVAMRSGRAFLMHADGTFLCLSERGHLMRLTLDPKKCKVEQRVRLFLAPETWSPLVLHRGLLYVCQNSRDLVTRKEPRLLCYDLRGR